MLSTAQRSFSRVFVFRRAPEHGGEHEVGSKRDLSRADLGAEYRTARFQILTPVTGQVSVQVIALSVRETTGDEPGP